MSVESGSPSSSPWYREGKHQGGGRARPAQTEGRVRLRVADANSVGAFGAHRESEPGCVAHDVVVGQHPGGGGSDRVRRRERVGDGVASVSYTHLTLQRNREE